MRTLEVQSFWKVHLDLLLCFKVEMPALLIEMLAGVIQMSLWPKNRLYCRNVWIRCDTEPFLVRSSFAYNLWGLDSSIFFELFLHRVGFEASSDWCIFVDAKIALGIVF